MWPRPHRRRLEGSRRTVVGKGDGGRLRLRVVQRKEYGFVVPGPLRPVFSVLQGGESGTGFGRRGAETDRLHGRCVHKFLFRMPATGERGEGGKQRPGDSQRLSHGRILIITPRIVRARVDFSVSSRLKARNFQAGLDHTYRRRLIV